MKKLNEAGFIVADNAYKHQLLIKQFLENSLRISPENEIVYKDKFRYNYYAFNKRVNQLANLLYTLDYKGGATIGVLDYDSHRFLECYFAIPCTGNVLHTVNWRLSPEQMIYTINHAEDQVLIVHEDFLPIIEKAIDQLPTVEMIILIKEGEKMPSTSLEIVGTYENLLKDQSDSFVYPDFSEDTIATIFYTSGTTGNPKGAYFSHRQLVLHGLMEISYLGTSNAMLRLDAEDVYMPLTPMFHVHAWGIPYIATALGLKQVYVGKFDPTMFLQLFLTERPTISHSVPTILNMILSHPATATVDFSAWKILIGGSALPVPLARMAMDRGINIVTGYGLSETGPLLTVSMFNNKDLELDQETKANMSALTGRPVMLAEIKLIDEHGNTIPKDGETVGEVVARTPALIYGYYKDKAASEALWDGGYLHTGDLATWDEHEDLKIVDRLKDVIKTGGEWISSIDLESLILEHPAITEVAVIGIPDTRWGERPLALIVTAGMQELSKEDVTKHLHQYVDAERINKWAIPEQIHIVPEIPKTSVGKIDKKQIRQAYTG